MVLLGLPCVCWENCVCFKLLGSRAGSSVETAPPWHRCLLCTAFFWEKNMPKHFFLFYILQGCLMTLLFYDGRCAWFTFRRQDRQCMNFMDLWLMFPSPSPGPSAQTFEGRVGHALVGRWPSEWQETCKKTVRNRNNSLQHTPRLHQNSGHTLNLFWNT